MNHPIVLAALLACHGLASHAAGDAAAGKKVFVSRCSSCHAVGPYAQGGFGPQLNAIIGRPAAATPYAYSTAMRASKIVWTEAKLGAFISSPSTVVPGTKMRFYGLGSDTDIANLLAYLKAPQ